MIRDLKVILEGVFYLLIEEITTPIIIIGKDKKSINDKLGKDQNNVIDFFINIYQDQYDRFS